MAVALSEGVAAGAPPPSPLVASAVYRKADFTPGPSTTIMQDASGDSFNSLAPGTLNTLGYLLALTSTGGTAPIAYSRSVTANPSGKLSYTTNGSNYKVNWTGFIGGEQETATFNVTATDALGNSDSSSITLTFKRQ